MNVSLQKELFRSLRSRLAAEGFVHRVKHDLFARQRNGISDFFHVTCTSAKPGYWVAPGMSVRIERVEEIFHVTSGWNAKSRKLTNTMGTRIAASSGRLLLEKESDIALSRSRAKRFLSHPLKLNFRKESSSGSSVPFFVPPEN